MQHVALTARMLDVVPSSVPNPEEALISAQERAACVRRSPGLVAFVALGRGSLERAGEALRRIPAEEADAIGLWFGGLAQWEIADQLGVTQQAVSLRVQRGLERVRWLTGPGSWFEPADVVADLTVTLGAEGAELLATVWETTSTRETSRRLGLHRCMTHRLFTRLYRRELPEAARLSPTPFRRYLRGFHELRRWGHELLAPRRPGAAA